MSKTIKNLLFHLDTDTNASVFDQVVAYDGGADIVSAYGGQTPDSVGALVDGAIFTRPPKEKKHTALFISGGDLVAGQDLLKAVQKKFFANFRVSVMLDSNGSNTTAAAMVAQVTKTTDVKGKKCVILAGTGPVGQRAGVMMAVEGADVVLTSRGLDRAKAACEAMKERFGVVMSAAEAFDEATTAAAMEGCQIVLACGAAGIQLMSEDLWKNNQTLEIMSDANATPPLGFEGIDMMDKMKVRNGKIVFGGIGVGVLKLDLHRACIAQLFEANDQVLDAEEIYAKAKEMVAAGDRWG